MQIIPNPHLYLEDKQQKARLIRIHFKVRPGFRNKVSQTPYRAVLRFVLLHLLE